MFNGLCGIIVKHPNLLEEPIFFEKKFIFFHSLSIIIPKKLICTSAKTRLKMLLSLKTTSRIDLTDMDYKINDWIRLNVWKLRWHHLWMTPIWMSLIFWLFLFLQLFWFKANDWLSLARNWADFIYGCPTNMTSFVNNPITY